MAQQYAGRHSSDQYDSTAVCKKRKSWPILHLPQPYAGRESSDQYNTCHSRMRPLDTHHLPFCFSSSTALQTGPPSNKCPSKHPNSALQHTRSCLLHPNSTSQHIHLLPLTPSSSSQHIYVCPIPHKYTGFWPPTDGRHCYYSQEFRKQRNRQLQADALPPPPNAAHDNIHLTASLTYSHVKVHNYRQVTGVYIITRAASLHFTRCRLLQRC